MTIYSSCFFILCCAISFCLKSFTLQYRMFYSAVSDVLLCSIRCNKPNHDCGKAKLLQIRKISHEGALPYISHIGMCRCKGYGLQAI